MNRPFFELALAVISATTLGVFAKFFRQPLILAYVIVGIVLGPSVLNVFQTPELIQTLSTLGVAFLLFMVGLELDLKRVKEISVPAMVVGFGQILFTAIIGYILVRFFDFSRLTSLYIAIALTFSSTVIVVKLLSEKQDLDSWYGRLTVGMLVFQDLFAIIFIIILAALQKVPTVNVMLAGTIIVSLLKGILLFVFTLFLGQVVVRPLMDRLGRNPELLFLVSVSWCLLFAMTSVLIGFSIEIGSFFAGLSLATLPYHVEIASRIRSLRDFFLTLFFVALGSQFILADINNLWTPFIVLTLFILIGNPLIVLILMGFLGYKKRISFFVAMTTAQISEFSIILMSWGGELGHVPHSAVFLVTLIGIVTIPLSTYFIIYTEELYQFFSRFLDIFERKDKTIDLGKEPELLEGHVVLFGYHRMGATILKSLEKMKYKVTVVDFDPEVIKNLMGKKKTCLYGDVDDQELLEHLRLDKAAMVISTIPDFNDSIKLVQTLRRQNVKTPVYCTAQTSQDTLDLYEAGADYVIYPHYLSAKHFSFLLEEAFARKGRISRHKAEQIATLKTRYSLLTTP